MASLVVKVQRGADAMADTSPTVCCISEKDAENREPDGCRNVSFWANQPVSAGLILISYQSFYHHSDRDFFLYCTVKI